MKSNTKRYIGSSSKSFKIKYDSCVINFFNELQQLFKNTKKVSIISIGNIKKINDLKVEIFNKNQKEKINLIINAVIQDKLLGCNYNRNYIENFTNVMFNKNTLYNSKHKNQILNYIDSSSQFVNLFDNKEELIQEILIRIDIYGFGLILLQCVGYYLKTEIDVNPSFIVELMNLVGYCCISNYKIKNMSMKEIILKFKSIIKNYTSLNGGTQLGQGSHGVVYGFPRLPCIGDDNLINDEVSKVLFNENKDVTKEYDEIWKRLKEYITKDDIKNLKPYFIFPIKKCEIDENKLKEYPYNSKEYFHNLENIYKEDINFNKYKQQIIYKKGDYNLDIIFKNQLEPFIAQLKHILNIGHGLRILHSHGFVHLDVSVNNCILDNNTYKIIDLSKLCYFKKDSDFRQKQIFNISNFYLFPIYPSFLSALLSIL